MAITRIQSNDAILNRLQDQLLREVNPALRRLEELAERPVVEGSRGGSDALTSLLRALAEIGLITDRSTP